jgi:membrane protease YdiL (CAAX protease family)
MWYNLAIGTRLAPPGNQRRKLKDPDMNHDQHDFTPKRVSRGRGTLVAWLVVGVATLLTIGANRFSPRSRTSDKYLGKALLELQGRYLVGAATLMGDQEQALQQQLAQWKTPEEWQRLRVAVLAAEFLAPEAGLEQLAAGGDLPPEEVDKPPQDTSGKQHAEEQDASDEEAAALLKALFQHYSRNRSDSSVLSEAERDRLTSQLGWFGRLALAPPGEKSALRDQVVSEAQRTFYTVIGVAVVFLLIGLLGLFVLLGFVTLLAAGRLPTFDTSGGYGGVYAEAFACWLVLFLALNLAGAVWLGQDAIASTSLLSFLGSLLALRWPLMRGVSWQRVREDLGWTMGRGVFRELFAGLGGYAMAIPLVLLSALLVAAAGGWGTEGADPARTPVHPVAQWLAEADWWQRTQLLLLACVAAPIVEETMFRGFLYRHLREASRGLSRWLSVLFSAAAAGVLFAVLHPQGLLAVPGILGIALALAFIREWRNTLLPSILAHGVNNAVVTVLLIALLV